METDDEGFHSCPLLGVLILPMRNGNNELRIEVAKQKESSYPTYEEWKPFIIKLRTSRTPPRSYPTYEEWKLLILYFSKNSYKKSSYPTYEEWKHSV